MAVVQAGVLYKVGQPGARLNPVHVAKATGEEYNRPEPRRREEPGYELLNQGGGRNLSIRRRY